MTLKPSEQSAHLAERLGSLRARVEAACQRVQRSPNEVTLVAVTKSVSGEVAALLPALGVFDLGESRPQELWHKSANISGAGVRWHLIGHLQRNKIERTLPLVHLIHSVDSTRLLTALDQEAVRQQRSIDVLLEVNASRESNKHGFTPEEVPGLVPTLASLRQVHVRGLMTMAALEANAEQSRPTFALVRALRDRLRRDLGPPHRMDQLSMGMSNDFEVALEEGATLVRIGTAIFDMDREERAPP